MSDGMSLPYDADSELPYNGGKQPYTRKKKKADGGALSDGPVLPIPDRLPNRDDLERALDVAKSFLTPVDPYEAAGKAVEQYRGGHPLDAAGTMAGAMPGLGIVPVEHALASGVPKSLPKDELFTRAVENTPGAVIDNGALVMPVARRQMPVQHGDVSVRGGVFYLPEGDKRLSYYNGTQGYGGLDKISGTTALLNPLFVKGATGGKAPEAAFAALKGKDAMKQLDRDVFGVVNEKHWMQRQDPSLYSERVANLLSDYGADPWLADNIIEYSSKGDQLRYALQENIIGNAVRNAGHDAVLGYSMGRGRNPFLSELFDVRESHYPTPQGGYEVFDQFMPKADGGSIGLPYGGSGLPYSGGKEPYTPRKKKKAEGGALMDPVLPIPTRLPNSDDLNKALEVAKSFLTPTDPYEEAGKAVEQYRSGNPVDAFATMAGAMPQTGAIIAYHGSPHKFDRFDISKIGTGEGAQAYGHGLYFADREDVARNYRDNLSRRNVDATFDGKPIEKWPAVIDEVNKENWRLGKLLDEYGRVGGDYGDFVRRQRDWYRGQPDMEAALGEFEKRVTATHTPGSMYEVAIHADPEHFLDWDKPLREQPQNVREWFDSRGITPGFAGNQSGAELYTAENTAFGSQPAVSDAMRQSGIPGIKYLDHGSRFNAVDGKGPQTNTRNYVVFDDKLIDILRKYASGGEVSAPITGEHTITMDDLIGRAAGPASTPGAYTDAGGQKIAAPYVSGMANGYPIYSPQTAISDALNVAQSILPKHKRGMNTGTPVYTLAGA